MVNVLEVHFFILGVYLGIKRVCRSLLFINGTHLIVKYGGTLLGVICKDENNCSFHMAFGIVDNKIDAN